MPDTDTTASKPTKPRTKKFVAAKKFGYSKGTANIGDVVDLTSAEAKSLNKSKAIAPHIEDDDD